LEKDEPFVFKKKPEPESPPAKGRLFGLQTDAKPSAPAPKPSAQKPAVPELIF
jgi:hypothetical protein